MNKITLVSILFIISVSLCAQTQNSDSLYRKPLKEVLIEIENKFHIKLKYKDTEVKDKILNYADWRFRPSLETTLTNVLSPFDMKYIIQPDDSYKIKFYEYHRWSVEDGKMFLDSLSTLYNDVIAWEKRKAELKECLYKALLLSPLPAKSNSKPLVTPIRKMDGYTIENFAIETLPGLYVCGSVYKPLKIKGKIPVVLCPNGHFEKGRYNPDQQYQCAMLARMGAIAASYDLFAWGESLLQFKEEDHRKSHAMTIQVLNNLRILDYLLVLPEADSLRVAITGGSGGGSQTVLLTALDERIKVSVPVVSLSCYFFGGCPCESGMPIHFCSGGTNNVEIAAMAAPKPQLIISDGKDWTDYTPKIEYPYLQKIYSFYGKKDNIKNEHFINEGHDYGVSKRMAMYPFIAQHLNLDLNSVKDKNGNIDESKVTIEEESAMYVFGKKGENLPTNAIRDFNTLCNIFENTIYNKP
jgi:hypothetical protein